MSYSASGVIDGNTRNKRAVDKRSTTFWTCPFTSVWTVFKSPSSTRFMNSVKRGRKSLEWTTKITKYFKAPRVRRRSQNKCHKCRKPAKMQLGQSYKGALKKTKGIWDKFCSSLKNLLPLIAPLSSTKTTSWETLAQEILLQSDWEIFWDKAEFSSSEASSATRSWGF